jgi:beta-mannosidase
VLITAAEYEDELRVSLINDLAEEISGEVILKLNSYSGETLSEKVLEAKISSCDSKTIFSEKTDDFLNGNDRKNCYLIAEFINPKISSRKILHFSTLKNAALQNPDLVVEAINNDEIKISVNKIAKCVYLECDDSSAQFSDNYFDILPGKEKTVRLIPVKTENPVDVNAYQNITAISLYDLK